MIAFIMFGLSALPVFGLKMRFKPPAVRRLFDSKAWRDTEFTLYALALFLGYAGMYVPYFYIQLYCLEEGILNGDLEFYLLPIMNGAGFFGRIVSTHLLSLDGSLISGTAFRSHGRQDRSDECIHRVQWLVRCLDIRVDRYSQRSWNSCLRHLLWILFRRTH